MNNALTKTEAAAVMALNSILFCKSQLARLMAFKAMQNSPACDWLLERGFVAVRTSNVTRQFTDGEAMAYVTPAGKKWFYSTPGPGVAGLVLWSPSTKLAA